MHTLFSLAPAPHPETYNGYFPETTWEAVQRQALSKAPLGQLPKYPSRPADAGEETRTKQPESK